MIIRENERIQLDISKLLEDFKKKWRNIFLFQFEEKTFVYRAIGRKEYKNLVFMDMSNEDREEELCRICTLYPENFDFRNCEDAGLPTRLAEEIYKNSYLSAENRSKALTFYRSEMFDLDNQINCIINSAFPHLKLEEIEEWDVLTASKYYSRAEWVLKNIGGANFEDDPDEIYRQQIENTVSKSEEVTDEDIEEMRNQPKTPTQAMPPKKDKNSKKKNLTPEEVEDLKRRFPNIDWDQALHTDNYNTIKNTRGFTTQPMAMLPRNKKQQYITQK